MKSATFILRLKVLGSRVKDAEENKESNGLTALGKMQRDVSQYFGGTESK